jgi:hypothetical protein
MGSLFMTTVAFALAAAFAMLWAGGTWFPVFLAYMAGGWMGLGLSVAAAFWHAPRD